MAETVSALRKGPSPAESEAVYRQLLGLNPRDQSALFGLTQALRAQGRFGEALALLQSARGQIKLDKVLVTIFAELKLMSGDPVAAAQAFREVLKDDPNNTRAYVGLGRAQVVQNQFASAEETFKTALRADENSVDALAALSELALGRNELDYAVKLGQQAVEINPKHPLAQTAYGMALARQGHVDFAIQCFKNAVEADPDFHPARLALAELLLRRGDLEVAGQLFAQLIQAVPNWGPPRHGMARAALLAGQPEMAENLLVGLIPRDPRRMDLRLEYTQALMLQRKLDLADMALAEALNVSPGLIEAELMQADCLRLRGQLGDAEAAYRRLTEIHPARVETHLSLCTLLDEMADFSRLEAATQAGLALAPTSALMRLSLARAQFKRNAHEQAIHELKLIDPKALDALRQVRLERTFARSLEALGQPQEALKHYLNARHLVRDTDAAVAELEPASIAPADASAGSEGANLLFLLGLPGSGVEVIGRVLRSIDSSLVDDDRLGFDIRRVDIFADAVLSVRSPLTPEDVALERERYTSERAKLPAQQGAALDWVPGSAQALSLIHELYPQARVVLVERDLRDCVAEVIACGALVQTAPFDPLKLAESLKRSQDGIKVLKARLGKRLFSLNPNEFIERPDTSLAALNRFLGTALSVPDWLTDQRTGDPWGVLRAAGSFKTMQPAWSPEVLEVLGGQGG